MKRVYQAQLGDVNLLPADSAALGAGSVNNAVNFSGNFDVGDSAMQSGWSALFNGNPTNGAHIMALNNTQWVLLQRRTSDGDPCIRIITRSGITPQVGSQIVVDADGLAIYGIFPHPTDSNKLVIFIQQKIIITDLAGNVTGTLALGSSYTRYPAQLAPDKWVIIRRFSNQILGRTITVSNDVITEGAESASLASVDTDNYMAYPTHLSNRFILVYGQTNTGANIPGLHGNVVDVNGTVLSSIISTSTTRFFQTSGLTITSVNNQFTHPVYLANPEKQKTTAFYFAHSTLSGSTRSWLGGWVYDEVGGTLQPNPDGPGQPANTNWGRDGQDGAWHGQDGSSDQTQLQGGGPADNGFGFFTAGHPSGSNNHRMMKLFAAGPNGFAMPHLTGDSNFWGDAAGKNSNQIALSPDGKYALACRYGNSTNQQVNILTIDP